MPAGMRMACGKYMNKDNKNRKGKNNSQIGQHNPADEGLDHNVRSGTEKDLNESYIQKQESNGGRGVDNEESTDEGEGAAETG